jgi:putative hydrolase of the HAD superfamily
MALGVMTSTFSKIRLVLLDADGVLQEPSREWLPTVESVCGDPARAGEFLEEFYAAEAMFMAGGEGVGDALEQLLRVWNSPRSVEEAMQLWRCIAKNHEILEIVNRIRARGTSVALASNQQPERARYMSQDLEYDLAFDHCFYSCDLGYAKPDSEYFRCILKKSGVLESEILFLDDREINVAAAKSLGIHAERFTISEGAGVFINILERYGVYNAQQPRGARALRALDSQR